MKKFWKAFMVGTAVLMAAVSLFACKKGDDSQGEGNPPGGQDTPAATPNTPEVKGLHFGADPFGGTWNETVPGIGLMLYCDAIDKNGNKIEDVNKISYSVAEGEATTAAGAKIEEKTGYKLRYLLATGAGKATVKVTVTDGEEKIEETKEITVSEVGEGKKFANYTAFGQSVYDGKLNINLDPDATAGEPAEIGRSGMVVTKNGLFVNRNRNITSAGTIGLLYCGDLGDNFEVTMDVTVYNISANDKWNDLIFEFWTGNKVQEDANAGEWFVNWNGGYKEYKLGANKSGDNNTNEYALSYATKMTDDERKDKVETGKTFTLKLSRTVSNGQATLEMEYTMDGTNYTRLLSIASAESTVAGNAGSKVINVVVRHQFAEEGCLEIGNIVKTKK